MFRFLALSAVQVAHADKSMQITVKFPQGTCRFEMDQTDIYKDDHFQDSTSWPGDTSLVARFDSTDNLSGCVAYKPTNSNCDWTLRIAASNPAVGHNKVFVSYRDGAYSCKDAWEHMDAWGQAENSYVEGQGHYDNPSSISYDITPPSQCMCASQLDADVEQKQLVAPRGAGDAVVKTVGLAVAVLATDGEELVEKATEFLVKALVNAFTHKRTITVKVSFTRPVQLDYSGTYEDDGVKIAYDDTAEGSGRSVTVTFHNDGSISGCMEFGLRNCNWRLRVAGSNPTVGHNKAKASFLENSGKTCYQVWDDMDSWGETEGQGVKKVGHDVYENPSGIRFSIDTPSECVDESELDARSAVVI